VRVARLLTAHGYALRYGALESGRVSVGWYLVSGHGRSSHRSLIASGTLRVHGPGAVTVQVRLTAAGRRLLRSHRTPGLTAVASFTGAGLQVTRTGGFALDAALSS